MKKKAWVVPAALLGLLLQGEAGFGQDCLFETGEDESLSSALRGFHDVMSGLVHGPAESGDFEAVGKEAEKLETRRDEILAARLPGRMSTRCTEISARARELSSAVDRLAEGSRSGADDAEVRAALEAVHDAYRSLRSSMTSLEDLLSAFHDVLHPLWHEAYPEKDTAAIRTAIPTLKVRARLIVAMAESREPSRVAGAKSLQEAVGILEEAAAAEDDLSILEGLRVMHDAYERLAEGGNGH